MSLRFTEEEVIQATSAQALGRNRPTSFQAVETDTRTLTPGALFVALVGERFDAHQFVVDAVKAGAGALVVAKGRALPGLPDDFPRYEVQDTLTALGDLARWHRKRFRIPIGAVTGSNGKTTTKEMIGSILAVRGPTLKTQGNLNNEVGVPLTLFRLSTEHVAAIVEMGMNHAGEIARLASIAQPDAGLITIVQPAHLEGLGSIEGVAAAKGELFVGIKGKGVAVVNLDDTRIVKQAQSSGARQLTFGRSSAADVQLLEENSLGRDGFNLSIRVEGKAHPVRLHFIGSHNALNATGAFALALALGYTAEECVRGLESARPHAMRLQLVEAEGGITVMNDAYNANPSSMAAALSTLRGLAQDGRAVAVLGDMLELGATEAQEHEALGTKAAESADRLVFFGPRSQAGATAARARGKQAEHFLEVDSLVAHLKSTLSRGDVVLVKGSRGMRLERVVTALTGAGGDH